MWTSYPLAWMICEFDHVDTREYPCKAVIFRGNKPCFIGAHNRRRALVWWFVVCQSLVLVFLRLNWFRFNIAVVKLSTQAYIAFQIMLPEAAAIVMAPADSCRYITIWTQLIADYPVDCKVYLDQKTSNKQIIGYPLWILLKATVSLLHI